MILRGCKLKNTDWIVGVVIYTGVDTAIMMNGSSPFTKISNIERKVNRYILIILALEIILEFTMCDTNAKNDFAFKHFS